jgi:hypothetical protein
MEKVNVKEFNSAQVEQKYAIIVSGNQEYFTGSAKSNINNTWESM